MEWDVTLRRTRVQEYTLSGIEAETAGEAERLALRETLIESDWTGSTTEATQVVGGRTAETHRAVFVDRDSAGDMCGVLDRLLTMPALGDGARTSLSEMRRRLTPGPR